MQFDREEEFKGYKILFFRKRKAIPVQYTLTKEEYEERKSFLIWIDFLIKTEQWVPYSLYKEVFDNKINEDKYEELHLSDIITMEITYEEYYRGIKDINLED